MSQYTGKEYGHNGIAVGTTFKSRAQLLHAGVHGQLQAGIHGDSSPDGGAWSICLSGGYEDNEDRGNKITYVGSGGQDASGEQIADQSFSDSPNQALLVSYQKGRPVRVVRGKSKESNWAPASGYRYDGLYIVDSADMRRGKKGFNMCFFGLKRQEDQPSIPYRNKLFERMLARRRKAGR